jgi:chromosome segregation ATPase
MEEMIAQMVYKDSRIVDLDSQMHQLNQTIMDLRENIAEKDEVIRGRDQAIQIIQATLVERTTERDRLLSAQVESIDHQTTTAAIPDRDGALQEVLDSLQQRLLVANEQLAVRDRSLEQITAECQLKDQSLTELLAQCKALEEKCGSVEQSYSLLNQSYAELYQNYFVLMGHQRDAENANDVVQRERQSAEEQRAGLERRCRELEEQLGAVEKNRTALERTCAESQAARDQLQRELDDLKAHYAEQKRNVETFERNQASHEQNYATLEHNFMQLQMKHIELEQTHAAALAKLSDLDAVQKKCSELERRNVELAESYSELERSQAVGRLSASPSGDTLHETLSEGDQKSQIEKLKKDAEACETRFSKFKALAGSKIKALEKELEELKHVCDSVFSYFVLSNLMC